MRKALVYTVDDTQLALALFSAKRFAELSRPRDFDILICSFEPLEIPQDFAALGIRNEVYDLRDIIEAERLPIKWLPAIAYMRLWLAQLLADRYDRIFYTDADTYPRTSQLSRFFEIDFGPHAIAAALDKGQWWHQDRPMFDFEDHGIPCNRYFNSGLCLFHVARFNQQDLLGQMLDINRSGIKRKFHDQSLLNLVTKGAFAEFSPLWNWQWADRFPAFTWHADPMIIHLSGPPRPWQAHERPTRFSAGLIEEYSAFLERMDSPLAFHTSRRGGLRHTLRIRARTIGEYMVCLPNYLSLMKRHADPFDTRLED